MTADIARSLTSKMRMDCQHESVLRTGAVVWHAFEVLQLSKFCYSDRPHAHGAFGQHRWVSAKAVCVIVHKPAITLASPDEPRQIDAGVAAVTGQSRTAATENRWLRNLEIATPNSRIEAFIYDFSPRKMAKTWRKS